MGFREELKKSWETHKTKKQGAFEEVRKEREAKEQLRKEGEVIDKNVLKDLERKEHYLSAEVRYCEEILTIVEGGDRAETVFNDLKEKFESSQIACNILLERVNTKSAPLKNKHLREAIKQNELLLDSMSLMMSSYMESITLEKTTPWWQGKELLITFGVGTLIALAAIGLGGWAIRLGVETDGKLNEIIDLIGEEAAGDTTDIATYAEGALRRSGALTRAISSGAVDQKVLWSGFARTEANTREDLKHHLMALAIIQSGAADATEAKDFLWADGSQIEDKANQLVQAYVDRSSISAVYEEANQLEVDGEPIPMFHTSTLLQIALRKIDHDLDFNADLNGGDKASGSDSAGRQDVGKARHTDKKSMLGSPMAVAGLATATVTASADDEPFHYVTDIALSVIGTLAWAVPGIGGILGAASVGLVQGVLGLVWGESEGPGLVAKLDSLGDSIVRRVETLQTTKELHDSLQLVTQFGSWLSAVSKSADVATAQSLCDVLTKEPAFVLRHLGNHMTLGEPRYLHSVLNTLLADPALTASEEAYASEQEWVIAKTTLQAAFYAASMYFLGLKLQIVLMYRLHESGFDASGQAINPLEVKSTDNSFKILREGLANYGEALSARVNNVRKRRLGAVETVKGMPCQVVRQGGAWFYSSPKQDYVQRDYEALWKGNLEEVVMILNERVRKILDPKEWRRTEIHDRVLSQPRVSFVLDDAYSVFESISDDNWQPRDERTKQLLDEHIATVEGDFDAWAKKLQQSLIQNLDSLVKMWTPQIPSDLPPTVGLGINRGAMNTTAAGHSKNTQIWLDVHVEVQYRFALVSTGGVESDLSSDTLSSKWETPNVPGFGKYLVLDTLDALSNIDDDTLAVRNEFERITAYWRHNGDLNNTQPVRPSGATTRLVSALGRESTRQELIRELCAALGVSPKVFPMIAGLPTVGEYLKDVDAIAIYRQFRRAREDYSYVDGSRRKVRMIRRDANSLAFPSQFLDSFDTSYDRRELGLASEPEGGGVAA